MIGGEMLERPEDGRKAAFIIKVKPIYHIFIMFLFAGDVKILGGVYV